MELFKLNPLGKVYDLAFGWEFYWAIVPSVIDFVYFFHYKQGAGFESTLFSTTANSSHGHHSERRSNSLHLQMASASILVFDYFETLALEKCSILLTAIIWFGSAGVTVSELILLLRTFALWGKDRTLLISLLIFSGCTGVACILITNIYTKSWKYKIFLLPNISGCFSTNDSKISLIAVGLLLVNETGKLWHNQNRCLTLSNSSLVIFILTIWIGVKRYRHSITPLVSVLYRDGVLYYAFIIGITCGYIFVMVMGPKNYHDLSFT
ncbi:hypothetical protein BDZ94DRAFT_1239506 [Collybia nuda]|uniref:Uncharacterized protein n=1 Tax=Collybia nuda TaxID=64659 RepID=A0A9P6CEE3_9AGAR|nr:hypothetical protein BDZ94DRAFT_1239506 [Collybia nuda]